MLRLQERKLERIVKGFSNHRRIQMMALLSDETDLSLSEVAGKLNINMKTASEHLRRLAISGLVVKRYRSANVLHSLSPLGVTILKFLRILE